MEVSSVLLWERAFREHSQSFRFHRIFRNLVLILQIAVVAFAVFALAGPSILGRPSYRARNLILILDTTASMQAAIDGTGGRTRFDEARRVALEVIDGLRADARVMFVQAGASPELRAPFLSDRDTLKRLIRDAVATDEAGSVRDAVLMALRLADYERGDEIYLVSDGAFEFPEQVNLGQARLEFFPVGESSRNIGIIRFETRKRPGTDTQYETLTVVASYAAQTISAELDLRIDGSLVASESLVLEPSEEKTLITRHERFGSGRLVAELSVDDDLDVDDKAYSVLIENDPIRVLLVTPGNFFLETVLSVLPLVLVETSGEAAIGGDYDIVIYDRIPAPHLESGRYVLIDSEAPNVPIESVGVVEFPEMHWWDTAHPVLSGVNFGTVTIFKGSVTETSGNVNAIARSHDTDLIYTYESAELRVVYIGFDLMESDIPLKVAFPVMTGNILRWLSQGNQPSSSYHVRAGARHLVPVGSAVNGVSVVFPSGRREAYDVRQGSLSFEDTSEVGFYTYEGSGGGGTFAVSLLNQGESNLRRRFPANPIDQSVRDEDVVSGEGAKSKREVWIYLILAAFVAVIAEWYLWLRERGKGAAP